MKCARCGSELNNGANFCSNCGAPVKAETAAGTDDILMPYAKDDIQEDTKNEERDIEDELGLDYLLREAEEEMKGEDGSSSFTVSDDDDDEDYEDFAYQERRAKRQARKKKQSHRHVAVLVICGVVLVAVVGAVLAKTTLKKDTDTTTTAAASSSVVSASTVSSTVVSSSVVAENTLSAEELSAAVTDIDTQYKDIAAKMKSGDLTASAYTDGVTAYWSDNTILAIVAESGSEGSQYDRSYYYDANGNLIYADLEGTDAYHLYYKDSELIRLSYAKDAKSTDDVTNYDQTATQEYLDWQSSALDYSTTLMTEAKAAGIVKSQDEIDAEKKAEEEKKAQEEEAAKAAEEAKKETEAEEKAAEETKTEDTKSTDSSSDSKSSGYIFADSNSEYIAEDDLKDMSKSQVRLALNEIYARNGATFDSDTYKKYFESKSWYKGTCSKSEAESKFNKYETANVKMIVNYEKSKGWR